MSQPTQSKLTGIAPYFFVSDIKRSAAYYQDVLGFTVPRLWGEPPGFCMPQRDGLVMMLCQADNPGKVQPNGRDGEAWDAYVWVTDADALCEEFKSMGVLLQYAPEDKPFYGNREFAIRDPDGYVIAFGHSGLGKRHPE